MSHQLVQVTRFLTTLLCFLGLTSVIRTKIPRSEGKSAKKQIYWGLCRCFPRKPLRQEICRISDVIVGVMVLGIWIRSVIEAGCVVRLVSGNRSIVPRAVISTPNLSGFFSRQLNKQGWVSRWVRFLGWIGFHGEADWVWYGEAPIGVNTLWVQTPKRVCGQICNSETLGASRAIETIRSAYLHVSSR